MTCWEGAVDERFYIGSEIGEGNASRARSAFECQMFDCFRLLPNLNVLAAMAGDPGGVRESALAQSELRCTRWATCLPSAGRHPHGCRLADSGRSGTMWSHGTARRLRRASTWCPTAAGARRLSLVAAVCPGVRPGRDVGLGADRGAGRCCLPQSVTGKLGGSWRGCGIP